MGNAKEKDPAEVIKEIVEVIDQFDLDFDDANVALQEIAKIVGSDKVVCEDYDEDEDDEDDWTDDVSEDGEDED